MAIPRGMTLVPNDLLNVICEIVMTATEDLGVYDSVIAEVMQKNITKNEVIIAIEFAKGCEFTRR